MEIPWKSTLLVCYKSNIFWTPQVNQFDIRKLLISVYYRFILLDKIIFYGYWKALPSGISLMLHIALTLFLLCNGIHCTIFNCYINNHNSVLLYMFFLYCLSGWNYIFPWFIIVGENILRPGIYSIFGLYSSSISLHINTLSVLNFFTCWIFGQYIFLI